MPILTTGIIKNPLQNGKREVATLAVRYSNPDRIPGVVQIRGYYYQGEVKTEYVVDVVSLAPGMALDTQHYAQFDAFEFRFITSINNLKLKVWGKNGTGTMVAIYPLHTVDPLANPLHSQDKALENRLYMVNSSNNTLEVLDKFTKAPIASIPVGLNPQGVGINPLTGRVYVTNSGSNTVTVIDGFTNAVIATVLVGLSPGEVEVDSTANQIYITNRGSNTISVINGTTHTVMATINN